MIGPDLLQEVRICWENGNDDLWLKAFEKEHKLLFDQPEPGEITTEVTLSIEPPINHPPGTWPITDEREISAADPVIDPAERFCEKVVALDFDIWSDLGESCLDSARRAVVSLTVAGRKDQDCLHFVRRRSGRRGELNGYFGSAK